MRQGDRFGIPAALVVVVLAATCGLSAAQKPNILLILLDDLGYQDLSMSGSPDVKTPHIDKLCRDGVNFTDAHSVAGFCSPARAGLMSGINPWHFGHIFNPGHDLKDLDAGMPLHIKTVAEALRDAGYATMIAGKWHLGTTPQHHPMKRGFDRFFGFLNGRAAYFSNVTPGKDGRPHYIWDDYKIYEDVTYLTDDFAQKSMEFMEQSKQAGKPFFIYHSVNAPHGPLEFKPEDADNTIEDPERRAYVALIKAVDDTVKQLTDKIKNLGLRRETLVIFSNDNGGKDPHAVNEPLRDFKGSSYEGGIRVPFCMTWPKTIRWKTQNTQVISLLDVYPTLEGLAEVPDADKNPDLQGVDLMPFIIRAGKNKPPNQGLAREYQFGLKGEHRAYIRNGPWKLHMRRETIETPWHLNNEQAALYNLDDDITESNNLIKEPGNMEFAQMLLNDQFLPWYANAQGPAFRDAAGGNYFANNPLSVSITEYPETVLVGVEYPFVAVGSSTQQRKVYYFWEAFRREDEWFNTFNHVDVTTGVRRRKRYQRKPFITFWEPGEWIVRINIEDRNRWLQWTDLVVNVGEATPTPTETPTLMPVPTTASPVPTTASPVPTTASPVPTTASPVPTIASPAPTTPVPILAG